MMLEVSGSVPRTNGSGSGKLRNTDFCADFSSLYRYKNCKRHFKYDPINLFSENKKDRLETQNLYEENAEF